MMQLSAILFLVFLPLTQSFAENKVKAENSASPHPGPRSDEQAMFLFNEATQAKKDGKTELAIENFQKIIGSYPRFHEKFMVYQELMELLMVQKKYPAVLTLGKEAILQHPPRQILNSIQLFRADAQLQSGKALQSIIIIDELLKSKPDSGTVTNALLRKAEALSQLGKNKEAFASLDSARGDEKFADAELKIRARACDSNKPAKKQPLLDYFHEKNLCFKEAAALSRSSPAGDSAQVWCDRFKKFESELKKAKIDSFTVEKLQKELDGSKALSAPWGCT